MSELTKLETDIRNAHTLIVQNERFGEYMVVTYVGTNGTLLGDAVPTREQAEAQRDHTARILAAIVEQQK